MMPRLIVLPVSGFRLGLEPLISLYGKFVLVELPKATQTALVGSLRQSTDSAPCSCPLNSCFRLGARKLSAYDARSANAPNGWYFTATFGLVLDWDLPELCAPPITALRPEYSSRRTAAWISRPLMIGIDSSAKTARKSRSASTGDCWMLPNTL